MSELLSDYELSVIQTLRQDSKDLKDCYTRFSFQAIAFTAAVLGIVARYQSDHPYIALASIAPIILLITVARIGIYKYGSANRQYGYELHLFSTPNLPEGTGQRWTEMRKIGWEEAMRAWRIVQVTIFAELYETRKLMPMRLKKKYRWLQDEDIWFDIKNLVEPEAVYYPGSYLSTINSILLSLSLLSSIPIFVMSYQLDSVDALTQWYWYIFPTAIFIAIVYSFVWEHARRRIIESGLLSIHSCAITWQAVVVAHFRASNKSSDFKDYTKNLVSQANDLAKHVLDIHNWIYEKNRNDGIL